VAYLLYIIIYPFIFLFSRLPFGLLYRVSDVLYFVIYHLIGYRKDTVRENLMLVFPGKTEKERKQIEKRFYRHFADLFVEMVKAFHMSFKQMDKHFVFKNPELLNGITDKGQNIVIVGAHYGNWEWVFSLAKKTKAFPIATYLKINNSYFENFMLKNRLRFGGALIETKKLKQYVVALHQKNERFILGLLADQSPQRHRAKYWRSFLGVPNVPVFTGPEVLAKKYDAAFVFMRIDKIKRGYYEVNFELITDTPKVFPDYELTDRFLKLIEQQIKEKPAYYLWTHRRFKHRNKHPG